MIYLQVILTIFSILLLTTIILGVFWWKKYGKMLFSLMKPENSFKKTPFPDFMDQNPKEMLRNLDKLMKNINFNDLYKENNHKKR